MYVCVYQIILFFVAYLLFALSFLTGLNYKVIVKGMERIIIGEVNGEKQDIFPLKYDE